MNWLKEIFEGFTFMDLVEAVLFFSLITLISWVLMSL